MMHASLAQASLFRQLTCTLPSGREPQNEEKLLQPPQPQMTSQPRDLRLQAP